MVSSFGVLVVVYDVSVVIISGEGCRLGFCCIEIFLGVFRCLLQMWLVVVFGCVVVIVKLLRYIIMVVCLFNIILVLLFFVRQGYVCFGISVGMLFSRFLLIGKLFWYVLLVNVLCSCFIWLLWLQLVNVCNGVSVLCLFVFSVCSVLFWCSEVMFVWICDVYLVMVVMIIRGMIVKLISIVVCDISR